MSRKITFLIAVSLISIKSFSQDYYSFSQKAGGEYGENGKLTVSVTAGTGIGMKSSYNFGVEYGFKNVNGSIGVNFLRQSFKEDALFQFQSGAKDNIVGLYVKKSFYEKRFSIFGATGGGVYLSHQSEEDISPLSFYAEVGAKYKLTQMVGILINVYTNGQLDIAGGLGLSVSL
jgi:hypothetical protein